MRFNFFIKFFILVILFSTHVLAKTEEPKLRWNKAQKKLRNFRSFHDIFGKSKASTIGIEGRFISGSGQFTAANVSLLADKVKQVAGEVDKIILLDARLESHGFINDLPVEWKVKHDDANLNKSVDDILKDEKDRLLEIFKDKIVDKIVVKTVSTEEEVAALNGFEYVRLPTLDRSLPSDEIVDAFLELIKNNPNAWLHVHCHIGKGRTTTFMVLYDMFYNAKDLKFDEILFRHKIIGGSNLNKSGSKERLEFLKRFYRYSMESDPQNVTWQAWLQEQPIN